MKLVKEKPTLKRENVTRHYHPTFHLLPINLLSITLLSITLLSSSLLVYNSIQLMPCQLVQASYLLP